MRTQHGKWQRRSVASGADKSSNERRVALLALGITRALRDEKMSLAQAEDELFNPDLYRELKQLRFDRRILELISWGMELENVYAIGREPRIESFDAIEALASSVLASHHQNVRLPRQVSRSKKDVRRYGNRTGTYD